MIYDNVHAHIKNVQVRHIINVHTAVQQECMTGIVGQLSVQWESCCRIMTGKINFTKEKFTCTTEIPNNKNFLYKIVALLTMFI